MQDRETTRSCGGPPEDLRRRITSALAEVFAQADYNDALLRSGLGDEAALDDLWPLNLVPISKTVITLTIKDGVPSLTKCGQTIAEVSLDRLGNKQLADAIGAMINAAKSLDAMSSERSTLQKEVSDLHRFVAYGPACIETDIKMAFPDGTAGKNVDISESPTGSNNYRLTVDDVPRGNAVDRQFGQAIVARKLALQKAHAQLQNKTSRVEELGRKINDLRQARPSLEQRVAHLVEDLDFAALKVTLGGDYVGIKLDDRGQPVILVAKEVSEELAELPDELKRQLVARHLMGDELPAELRKALGIEKMIAAVDRAAKTPKTKPAKN